MSKYQKALSDTFENVIVEVPKSYSDTWNESYVILQELVDKETPMKSVNKEIENISVSHYIPFIIGVCPNCEYESINEIHTYCSSCGQKLDWTDEDV